MSHTLADMTPAERAACVGRWAERKNRLVVITDVIESIRTADWYCPATASAEWDGWVELTPRYDLPRAWTPEGEPVPGEWDDDQGRNLMRRWVSNWEWKHDTPQHIRDEYERKA